MMGGFDQGPLTDEEIEELDQFLLDAKGIEESMCPTSACVRQIGGLD
jgi:hypothetical protein